MTLTKYRICRLFEDTFRSGNGPCIYDTFIYVRLPSGEITPLRGSVCGSASQTMWSVSDLWEAVDPDQDADVLDDPVTVNGDSLADTAALAVTQDDDSDFVVFTLITEIRY